jgi:membrane-associated protein
MGVIELIKGIMSWFIDFILHLDTHLSAIIQTFGAWTYVILFLIIFAETGLVAAPFLPGDSLLFAVGTFAALGSINIWLVYVILLIAAILGDSLNYSIGKFIGPKVFKKKDSKIFKKAYIDKTEKFYEKYGPKAIVIARFVPIVRTFAPFIAGVGKMEYSKFLFYNVFGGFIWVTLLLFLGFFFGNIPIIRENFEVAIFVIIILSFLPMIYEYWKHKKGKS